MATSFTLIMKLLTSMDPCGMFISVCGTNEMWSTRSVCQMCWKHFWISRSVPSECVTVFVALICEPQNDVDGLFLFRNQCQCDVKGNSHVDGLVQESRNFIANTLELHLSCTSPSICAWTLWKLPLCPNRYALHFDRQMQKQGWFLIQCVMTE